MFDGFRIGHVGVGGEMGPIPAVDQSQVVGIAHILIIPGVGRNVHKGDFGGEDRRGDSQGQDQDQQDGQYLFFESGGKVRQFVLPDCVSKGFLIPDNQAVKDRYCTEASLLQQIETLEREQKLLNRELMKYQQ